MWYNIRVYIREWIGQRLYESDILQVTLHNIVSQRNTTGRETVLAVLLAALLPFLLHFNQVKKEGLGVG